MNKEQGSAIFEDAQSIRVLERQHARDQLAEAARHLHEECEPCLLGCHLATELGSRRVMRYAALAAVTALVAAGLLML